MAPVIPDPTRIREFPDQASFEAWLSANHARETEIWLKLHKKGSGLPTVSYAEALDVALSWGWIDGLKKSFDQTSFLQRFSPRGPKSIWSQVNREHVARLVAAGRMTEHGQSHVDAAKADGRWDAAYAPPGKMEFPAALLAAIGDDPVALETVRGLSSANRYAFAFRLGTLKTEAARSRKLREFAEMLKRGETIHPNSAASRKGQRPA